MADKKDKKKTRSEIAMEKLENIGKGPEMDDKTKINEHISNLSSDNPKIRAVAAEYTGRIAELQGAEYVALCGGISQLKRCLLDDDPGVVFRTALAFSIIARRGGADMLLEEGVGDILMDIMKSPQHKIFEKNGAAQALGWIYAAKMIGA